VDPARLFALALVAAVASSAGAATTSRVVPPQPADVPLPPERPAGLGTAPPAKALPPVAPSAGGEVPAASGEVAACVARLQARGIVLERLPAIALGPCGAPDVFRLAALPDDLALTPPVTVTCPMAEGLAGWAKDVADAAGRDLHRRVSALATGTSYECRGQNHVATAKLSEHAFANALDLAGFRFSGGTAIAVSGTPPDDDAARFLQSVRASACRYFTTVLGPGSDPAHAEHLHLDMRQRRNGYRICQ
jgi:hypothetical protein